MVFIALRLLAYIFAVCVCVCVLVLALTYVLLDYRPGANHLGTTVPL